jgi:hypothetical protein
MGLTMGSPRRKKDPGIPRHAGCYLGVDPGPRKASVLIARLERMSGVPLEIAVQQVEQSCEEIL